MSYLLDTNVVSELRKPERRADPRVRFVDRVPRLGGPAPVRDHGSGARDRDRAAGRHDRIQAGRWRRWLDDDLLGAFRGRILSIDLPVARRAAGLRVPDPRPERDSLIAATAAVHGLTVVTRNVQDFATLGVAVGNPWEQGEAG